MTTDPTPAALRAAAMGYPVMPLLVNRKTPATTHGLKDSTLDAAMIRRIFTGKAYNLGLLAPAQVLVLDVDAPEVLPELEAEHPELAAAPLTRTPSGGAHAFVRVPPGWTMTAKVRALVGVDVRGLGRAYVVAPPSTVNGRPYITVRPLAPTHLLPLASDALLARLAPPRPPAAALPPAISGTERLARYVWAAVQREHDAVATAQGPSPDGRRRGERNAKLHVASVKLGSLVGAGALAEDDARDALLAAARTCGLPNHEAERTVASGLAYGKKHPRQIEAKP